MALRKIQDLSSYSLSAISDIFIPAATIVGPSAYRVVKITPSQITNAVFDRINTESITPVSVFSLSASIKNLTADNIFNNNFLQSSNITVLTLSSNLLTSTYIQSVDISTNSLTSTNLFNSNNLQSNNLQSNNITALTLSSNLLTSTSIQSVDISANSLTSTKIYSNNISVSVASINNLSAIELSGNQLTVDSIISLSGIVNTLKSNVISATQINAISATFNGFAPVAKYTAIIDHLGSVDNVSYNILQPFSSFQIISQIYQIYTPTPTTSASRLVLANTTNNGEGVITVDIIDPNNSTYQVVIMC